MGGFLKKHKFQATNLRQFFKWRYIVSYVSVEAKLSQIFQMAVSYHMRHVYRGVPPAHEEYEYSTCILSTSKGEAIANF